MRACRRKWFQDSQSHLVRDFAAPGAYDHLRGQDNVFLVVPSTTGRNKLPYYFAKHLQDEYGGEIATGWADPLVREKASMKGGLEFPSCQLFPLQTLFGHLDKKRALEEGVSFLYLTRW